MTDIARLGMAFDPRYVPVKVKRLHPDAVVPRYAHENDAGFDLVAIESVIIEPGETVLVRTGLAFEIPSGYEMQVRPRSGLSLKTKLRVANSPGTVDASFRGEVCVIVENIRTPSDDRFDDATVNAECIRKGDRIAQGVIQRVPRAQFEVVDELSETERGTGGFGSTGVGEDE